MGKELTHWIWGSKYWPCEAAPNQRDWHSYGPDIVTCPGCIAFIEAKRSSMEVSIQDVQPGPHDQQGGASDGAVGAASQPGSISSKDYQPTESQKAFHQAMDEGKRFGFGHPPALTQTAIELAPQDKIEKHPEILDRLLTLIGHPEALVTDLSTASDFDWNPYLWELVEFAAATAPTNKYAELRHAVLWSGSNDWTPPDADNWKRIIAVVRKHDGGDVAPAATEAMALRIAIKQALDEIDAELYPDAQDTLWRAYESRPATSPEEK